MRLGAHVLLAYVACLFCACASTWQVVQPQNAAQINRRAVGEPVALQARIERLLQEAAIRFEAQDDQGVIDILYRVLDRPNLPAAQKARATFFVAEAAWRQRQFLLAWPLYENLAKQSASVKRQVQSSGVALSQGVTSAGAALRWRGIAWVRLMQIADALGQWQQVASFYTSYAVQESSVSDLVHYLRGKAAFHLSQNNQALQHLTAVAEMSPYFQRARYLMGAIHVRLKNWQAAAQQFTQILTHDQAGMHRAVHERAVLALARLLYRQRRWQESIAFYQRVPADSSEYARALYEQALAFYALGNAAVDKGQQQSARRYYTTAADLLHRLQRGYPVQYTHPRVQLLLADVARKQGLRTRARAIYSAVLDKYEPIYRDLAKADKRPVAVRQLRASRLFTPPAHVAGQYLAVQELQLSFDPQFEKRQQSQRQTGDAHMQTISARTRAVENGIHVAWAPLLRKDLGKLLRWAHVGMMHLQIASRQRWQRKMNAVQQQRATAVQRSNHLFDGV